ncbi:MAG TPA: DUF2905 domain-containing protein [Anaerolineae bacterium]
MDEMGKWLILLGVVFVAVGLVVFLLGQIPGIGRLPGDIFIQRDNFSCFFPLATSILLSIVLTIVLNLVLRIIHR